MRIQKYLSEQKICSRREAEQYIAVGLVTVNGIVEKNPATQIDPARDVVELAAGATKDMGEKITIARQRKCYAHIANTSCRAGQAT